MSRKLVALLLSLVLAWAGLTTNAHAVSLAADVDVNLVVGQGEPCVSGADLVADVPAPFDDPASPAQAEPLADLTALVLACHPDLASIFTMSRPSAYTYVGRRPPFLAGLQRPPSRATAIA